VIGKRNKEKKLFYIRPEELIPQDHILRLIYDHINFFLLSVPKSSISIVIRDGRP
jgi:hypothetical protein